VIPLARPDVTEAEVAEVLSVLRGPTLSLGPKLREFEERAAALLGVRHAVAVSSGTAGLHLAVRAVEIGPGAEVITTPFSFVASANVLLFEQAVPVFVDVDDDTLNLAPGAVEETIEREYIRRDGALVNRRSGRRLAAILPVDVFGHPIDIDGFGELAARHRLRLIEDACEAFGSQLFSRKRGSWVCAGASADVSVFAFYPNKQITTGEGGLVATNDERVAAYCRMARNQGRQEGSLWLEHEALGFNYRLDELSAALGVGQLKRFDELARRRDEVVRRYQERLHGITELQLPQPAPWAKVNWFVYVVRVHPRIDRDALMRFLGERGIETRVYFPPIHLQPLYRQRFGFAEGSFPVCEAAARRTLALPFFNGLTEDQIEYIARTLEEGVRTCVAARPA